MGKSHASQYANFGSLQKSKYAQYPYNLHVSVFLFGDKNTEKLYIHIVFSSFFFLQHKNRTVSYKKGC